jgi:hypothetical protein
MMDAPAATGPETETDTFDAFDETLRAAGPEAAIEQLIRHLDQRGQFRALLDALLPKARHELGLPLIQVGSLADLPESARARFEEHYLEAIRSVGQRFLDAGDIPGAWPYFRAIDEPEPVARAIDAYSPADGDERLGQVVEVAFNHGANSRKGFELILDHYGTCSAISAFEHLPPDESVRVACAERLVRQLHEHLMANLRAVIAQRGQPLPPEGAPAAALLEGRDWLFADDAYHLDVSHLAAVVRIAPMLTDPATIALAVELTEYGEKLSPRHRSEGEPPFEAIYEDHGLYLRALIGRDVDTAIAHFRAKLAPPTRTTRRRTRRSRRRSWSGCSCVSTGSTRRSTWRPSTWSGSPSRHWPAPASPSSASAPGAPTASPGSPRECGDLVNYAAAVLQTKTEDSPQRHKGHKEDEK